MNITKYHGLGNDFIIIQAVSNDSFSYSKFAIDVCNRHSGIGADGLIVIKTNPLEMIYFNSDGSRAKMCGNGIRCFAHYVYENNVVTNSTFDVVTLAGLMSIEITSFSPFRCKVNMGKPNYDPKMIGLHNQIIDFPFATSKTTFDVSNTFLGTMHAVLLVDSLENIDMIQIGNELQSSGLYKDSVNVNFVELISKSEIRMQTYERGAGLTLACGTGASASVAVLHKKNVLNNQVKVHLPLGDLMITVLGDHSVVMEGPSEKILEGDYNAKT